MNACAGNIHLRVSVLISFDYGHDFIVRAVGVSPSYALNVAAVDCVFVFVRVAGSESFESRLFLCGFCGGGRSGFDFLSFRFCGGDDRSGGR